MRSNSDPIGIALRVFTETDVAEHSHQDIELLFVMEGRLTLIEEGERHDMTMGDVVIINSNRRHAIKRNEGTLACILSFQYRLFSEYSNHVLFWCNSMQDSDDSYAELREIIQALLLEYVNQIPRQVFQKYSLYYQLLQFIISHYLVHKDVVQGVSREEQKAARIAEIVSFIENNFDRDLSLQELAEYLHLSPTYLSKYFKKSFQMNFLEYLNTQRLRYATENLLYTDKPITRIAMDNGFTSMTAFNKIFRKANKTTPSVYRQKMRGRVEKTPAGNRVQSSEAEIIKRLRQHLRVEKRTEAPKGNSESRLVGDIYSSESYTQTWNKMVNLGAAKLLLQSGIRNSLEIAKNELGIQYIRIWDLFSPEMSIINHAKPDQNNFNKLNVIIDYILKCGMHPFIELGEKPERIPISLQEAVKTAQNTTEFLNYDEFIKTLDRMMAHLVSHYGTSEVESWIFELWDDHRVEVYKDKQPYRKLYRDVLSILKNYAPKIKLGGAGNHMGWHKDDTDISIRRWIDEGIYPDFISYDYYPYAAVEILSEKASKLKTDEDDFTHSLKELHKCMLEYGFPPRELYITDWNSTISQRNPLNDSCWKGCYILKNYLDTLGQADIIAYSQLSDITGDFSDIRGILGGMAGLISRDGIRKPAFFAFQFLCRLHERILGKNESAIITWDGNDHFSIVMHNYKARNYLYYFKRMDELSINELYQYFDNMDSKRVDVELKNIQNGKYVLRKSKLNQRKGSVLDEWMQMNCFENLKGEDVDYLRDVCKPHITISIIEVTDGTLFLPNDLLPLEMSLLEITRQN